MLRLAADENFNGGIVRGLSGADDPALLEWAAGEGRIVVPHDISTRVTAGLPVPGVFAVRSAGPVGLAIEDLLRLADCSLDGEWRAGALPAFVRSSFSTKTPPRGGTENMTWPPRH